MIIGIGTDTVDLPRFERTLQRTPALRQRLFAPQEQDLSIASLAARFAAKEALIKALGGSGTLGWHDMIVPRDGGRPEFVHTARLQAELAAQGGDRIHLSMSHDGANAIAFVIVESTEHGGNS